MLTRIVICLVLALTSGPSLFSAEFTMKVNDKNYLDTQGFSVFLYDSTYHPLFVDQKNTAMEMILHDQRIATNGDMRLMPTPEQWDLVATLKGRQADKANNRLTARPGFSELRFELHAGGRSGTGRRKGQRQSRQAATAESRRPRGLQPGVRTVDLHGQGLPGGRDEGRHISANA